MISADFNLVADDNTTAPTPNPPLSDEELAARYWPWYGHGDLLPCVRCLEVVLQGSVMWEHRIGRHVQHEGKNTTEYTQCLPAPKLNRGLVCLPCRIEGKSCLQICPAVAKDLKEALWQYFVVDLPKASPRDHRLMGDPGPPVGALKEKIYELICRHRWFWPPHNTS